MIIHKLFISRKSPIATAHRVVVKDRSTKVAGKAVVRFFGTFEQCADFIALHQGLLQVQRPH